jgi:hypothetical protein
VGDAAGQLPHRLHLLRLGELGLQVLAFGRIQGVDDDPRRAARAILAAAQMQLDDRIVVGRQMGLEGCPLLDAVDEPGQLRRRRFAVLLGDDRQQREPGPGRCLGLDQTAERLIALADLAFGVDPGDADRREIEKAVEAFLELAQFFDRVVVAGKVDDGAADVGLAGATPALGDTDAAAGLAFAAGQEVTAGGFLLARRQRLKRRFQDIGQGDPTVANFLVSVAQPAGQSGIGGQDAAVRVAPEQPDRRIVGQVDDRFVGDRAGAIALLGAEESA